MRKLFKCENERCGKEFFRSPHAISKHNYCSRSCSVSINNSHYPKRPAPDVVCASCGVIFRKTATSIFCSVRCREFGKQKYTDSQIRKKVKDLATTLGRTPSRRELGSMSYAAIRLAGSWNVLLKEIGLPPHRSHDRQMYRRTRTKARDGHICDSISEAVVDNWLTEHNIKHERDARYPTTKHRADWRVGNAFIEYFGLAQDSPRYDRAVKEKQEICRVNRITLISLYPSDLYPRASLENKLKILKGSRYSSSS